jgi:nucleotidyltransferase substrate binding protein (TIGR01987 family)
MTKDIRWIQRFNNFNKAFTLLKEAVDLAEQRKLSRLEALGVVHIFENTHELAWNTLKDFLEHRGATNLFGAGDATRAAFKAGLVENGEAWMQMIESRNVSAHPCDETAITKIVSAVINLYFDEFKKLQTTLAPFKNDPEYTPQN